MKGKIFNHTRSCWVHRNKANGTVNRGKQAVDMVWQKLNLDKILRNGRLKRHTIEKINCTFPLKVNYEHLKSFSAVFAIDLLLCRIHNQIGKIFNCRNWHSFHGCHFRYILKILEMKSYRLISSKTDNFGLKGFQGCNLWSFAQVNGFQYFIVTDVYYQHEL